MSAAGKWNVHMDTPLGAQNFVWSLQQTGQGWTGVMDAQSGRSELKNVKIDDDRIGFDARVGTPMGALDVTFTGEVQGDRISGSCRTAFGSYQFSGQRA